MLELGLKFTAAYLIGSILGGLVVGYAFGGVDIRKVGSGNAGGTNALRTQGKLFAFCVLVIDVGKGILAVTLIPGLDIPGIGIDAGLDRELVLYSVAFAAILGHVFPVWFSFEGGKGGATAAGLLCYFAPAVAFVIIGIWALIILLTGFVGLATISASLAAAAFIGLTRFPEEHDLFLFAGVVAALILYTHRSNIARMLQGTESSFRKKRGR